MGGEHSCRNYFETIRAAGYGEIAERRFCRGKENRRRPGGDARSEKCVPCRDRRHRGKREPSTAGFFGGTPHPRDFFGDGVSSSNRPPPIRDRASAKSRSDLRRGFRAIILERAQFFQGAAAVEFFSRQIDSRF